MAGLICLTRTTRPEASNSRGNQARNQRVLVIVEKAVDFDLPDQEGKSWRLSENLVGGPVVLVFYRGDW